MSTTVVKPDRRAHYILRRNLPLWKAAETIEETIAFCEEAGVGELTWKVDVEEGNHGFTPHDLIREYLVWFAKAKELQTRKDIIFSINPWVTLNHANRSRYPDGPPPGFHWRVRPDGTEAKERACPLSPGWREWFLEAYRLYATVRPDKLWLEDDFVTFPAESYVIGCFCETHLEAFFKRAEERLSREEIVERLLRPGEPDALRAKWFDFQGEVMVNVCREVEQVVHRESPNTRLGQMLSWSTDGRWWEGSIKALAGPLRPLSRSSLAPYEEGRAWEFLPDRMDILKETACIPQDTENCPELENCPYTAYSKSARMSRLQIAMSQVLGNSGITMNLFDMLGGTTNEDPRWGRMLAELKPRIDAVASIAGPGGAPGGVSIPYPKRYANTTHLEPRQGFEVFAFDGDGWGLPLQGSGIPVFLNGEARVSAVTGQSLRGLHKREIERLLGAGLLLDGSAAKTLCELGYCQHIGVRAGQWIDRFSLPWNAERDEWSGTYMSLRSIEDHRWSGRIWPLTLVPGARAASVLVDVDRNALMPGMTVFENRMGGRVAAYPVDLSRGMATGFMNWGRRRQLQQVVRWLGGDRVDLLVDGGAWMMPVRRDYPDYTLIAVLNFETDDWDELTLTFQHDNSVENPKIELLGGAGEFTEPQIDALERDGVNVRMRIFLKIAALDFVVFRIMRSSGP